MSKPVAVHPPATDARWARMPSQRVGALWSLRSSRGAATRAAGARVLARRGRAPVCVAHQKSRSRLVRCRGQPARRNTHALAARCAGPDSLHRRYQLPPRRWGAAASHTRWSMHLASSGLVWKRTDSGMPTACRRCVILYPVERQIEFAVNEGMSTGRHVGEYVE